jgi:hypothetical protein
MALGQIVGIVITWWQVIGMVWWEPRPDVSVQAPQVDLLKLRLADMPKVC